MTNFLLGRFAGLLLALAPATLPAAAQVVDRPLPAPQAPATATVTRNEPTALAFTPDKLARLKVPAGFTLSVMATDLGNARMLHVMKDGGIYLSRRASGDIWYLKDRDGDGKISASERRKVAENLKLVHGMDDKGGKLYAVGEKTIWVMDIAKDGTLGTPRVFADGFPDAGQHAARGLRWGPDGYLYASFGATNNDNLTQNPEEATVLRIAPDGKSREVYARGLRHTIGFDWQPTKGPDGVRALYGTDQGADWHGDDLVPEELNRIERGKNYGWPYCYADKTVDVYTPGENIPGKLSKAEYCAATQGSALNYTAHAAAIAFEFYKGSQFPAEYRDDAFVAYRGSWNRTEPSGYQIARVVFEGGKPVRIEPFVTGFVYQDAPKADDPNPWKQFGRVAGLATYTDGSLLFTDDQSGVLYRVQYKGGK